MFIGFLKSITVCFLMISLLCVTTFASSKQKNRVSKAKDEIAVPFSVEVDDDSSKKGMVITLALGKSTKFRCPEEPLQLIKGIPEALIREQGKPDRKEIEFYITPTLPVRTNIIVEMKSFSIDIQVRIIEIVGGANPNQYNGEVVIKPSKIREQIIKDRDDLSKVQEEVNKLKQENEELKQQVADKERLSNDQSYKDILAILESNWQSADKSAFIDTSYGLRVKQIGSAKKLLKGWIAVFTIENRGKDAQSIEDVRVTGARVDLTQTPRRILPRQETRIALLIEPESDLTPSQIEFVINGAVMNFKLRA